MPKDTRDIIRDTFMQLYNQHGWEKLSVKLVCNEANISRTTFYAYYDGMDSVLREIENQIIVDLFQINESFKI